MLFQPNDIYSGWKEGMELEASIKGHVNTISFNNTFSHIVYLCKNNIQQDQEVHDISTGDVRASINGKENISHYCKTMTFPKQGVSFMKKTKLFTKDYPDYNVRFRLSTEKEIAPVAIKEGGQSFRLKKRISAFSTDGMVRFDFTIVKQSNTISFKDIKEHREIEVELIGKKLDPKVFDNHLKDMLKAYYNDPAITSLDQKLRAINEYAKLCKLPLDNKTTDHIKAVFNNDPKKSGSVKITKMFVGAKPVTLERENVTKTHFPNIFSGDHLATIKADGERTLLFVALSKEVYIINSNLDFKFAGATTDVEGPTLFDGELVINDHDKPVIYLFDCYFYKNESVVSKNLTDRIDLCKPFTLQHYEVKVKEFKPVSEVKNMLENTQYPFDTDGIIYTPVGPAKLSGTWDDAYKWKPHHQNTIDFLVRFSKDNNGRILEYMESGVAKRKANLFVGSVPFTPADYFGKNAKGYIGVPFITDGNKAHTMKITTKQLCVNGDPVLDNHVIEAAYDEVNDNWVPYRVRYDKSWDAMINKSITSNNVKAAINIWNSITTPITVNDLVNGINENDEDYTIGNKYYNRKVKREKILMKEMNNFHNKIVKERNTFERLKNLKCSKLLDVACGKGGDIHKWIKSGFTSVVGVDVSLDNIINPIDGAYKRLSEQNISKLGYKYVFLPMDSSKPLGPQQIPTIADPFTQNLVKLLWGQTNDTKANMKHLYNMCNNKFDAVSCQFALHYFFKSDDTLNALLDNVVKNLKSGGYFVGTCFDGDTVAKKLKENKGQAVGKINNSKVWHIHRHYTKSYKPQTGQMIKVFIESINKEHEEYLVPYSLLKEKLYERGMSEVETHMFEEMYSPAEFNLSDTEKEFSFMNRWFMFKKS